MCSLELASHLDRGEEPIFRIRNIIILRENFYFSWGDEGSWWKGHFY